MERGSDGKIDWFVFWLRFVCGSLLGLLISVRQVLYLYDESRVTLVVIAVGVILLCGLGAACYGDEFWSSMFRR